MEAVGEGALVWVHIPASRERSPHTLPQDLKGLGTHLHRGRSTGGQNAQNTVQQFEPQCLVSTMALPLGVAGQPRRFHQGQQFWVGDTSTSVEVRGPFVFLRRCGLSPCTASAPLKPDPFWVTRRVTFWHNGSNPLNGRKVHLKERSQPVCF